MELPLKYKKEGLRKHNELSNQLIHDSSQRVAQHQARAQKLGLSPSTFTHEGGKEHFHQHNSAEIVNSAHGASVVKRFKHQSADSLGI